MAIGVRFLFAIMLSIANMIIYGLKVNMATTIIGMVKRRGAADLVKTCEGNSWYDDAVDRMTTAPKEYNGAKYDWNPEEQGLVISIYFAGYLIGMFPSGYCSDRFNTKWVLLTCIFLNGVFALLVPIACTGGLYMLLVLRFLTGLISSANMPVVNVLVGKWIIYEEKSMWVGIIYAGTSIGTVISILTSGLIMDSVNWESVFYIHGSLPFIWCVIFWFFFADNPETQKYITEAERELICNSYGHRKAGDANIAIPWKQMFTSVPFWALMVTNTLGNSCWYFLLTLLPLYMNKMLLFNAKENSGIACTPYLVNAIVNPCIGKGLDYGRRKGWWSQTTARKIAVTISSIPPCIMLIVIMMIQCNRDASVALLILSIITGGALFIGHLTNHNDLAPNFAGILMGITNTPGTLAAFILPVLNGAFNSKDGQENYTFGNWSKVFWISIATQFVAWLVFMIFGSANMQDWNDVPSIERAQITEREMTEEEVKSVETSKTT